MTNINKKIFVTIFKIIIPIGLLIYIFESRVKILEVYEILMHCRILEIVIALFILAVTRVQAGLRLYYMTSSYFKADILFILKDIFVGNLLNTILPTGSGEIYRIKRLSNGKHSISKCTALITLDRLFGILSILTIGAAFMMINLDTFNIYFKKNILYYIVATFIIFILIGFILKKIHIQSKILQEFRILFTFIYEYPFRAIFLYMYSIIITLTVILSMYFVVLSLDIKLNFINFLKYYPIVLIVTVLPISIGGLGIREIAHIAIFGPLGISNTQAVSLSLMQYALLLAISLVGLVCLLENLKSKDKN